jgi:hypothetical protein
MLIHPRADSQTQTSMIATAISRLFDWYAMRRGALLVGEGERPLAADLKLSFDGLRLRRSRAASPAPKKKGRSGNLPEPAGDLKTAPDRQNINRSANCTCRAGNVFVMLP